MLSCPMCKKSVRLSSRECPTCRADLSLLTDYVSHIEDGLARADALAREGALGEAVWAYLAVLEVDPDNPTARRQVGQVAAAVRQFDRIALGRRWHDKLQRQAHFRRWAETWGRERRMTLGLALVAGAAAALLALGAGWWLGSRYGQPAPAEEPRELLPEPREETVRRTLPPPPDDSPFLVFPRGPGRMFVGTETPPVTPERPDFPLRRGAPPT